MDRLTVRQAATEFLKRSPRSEWANFWNIYATLWPEAPSNDWPKVRVLSEVLEEMQAEGLVKRSGHTGWWLA